MVRLQSVLAESYANFDTLLRQYSAFVAEHAPLALNGAADHGDNGTAVRRALAREAGGGVEAGVDDARDERPLLEAHRAFAATVFEKLRLGRDAGRESGTPTTTWLTRMKSPVCANKTHHSPSSALCAIRYRETLGASSGRSRWSAAGAAHEALRAEHETLLAAHADALEQAQAARGKDQHAQEAAQADAAFSQAPRVFFLFFFSLLSFPKKKEGEREKGDSLFFALFHAQVVDSVARRAGARRGLERRALGARR